MKTQLMKTPVFFNEELKSKIVACKLLVVGAGGIGCEILKNLALSGFTNIEVIDLDTIDVSNLNRQFLFRKEHVGKSKAQIAKESMLRINSQLHIEAHHDSITTQNYGVNYFKKFDLVLNALDNRAARNHVNRMCLAADIPLIESGTSGYTGQVELIKKGLTQCYECQPKPAQKSFPGCTIRNTPSEPVHCIVWAKHLFNQLFGEDDPDQDVSPDTADPEAVGEAGKEAIANENEKGNVTRVSTHQWAQEIDYDPEKLFNKFFQDDIKYLLSMKNLWKNRTPPNPLSWAEAASHEGDVLHASGKEDMHIWSLSKCTKYFADSIAILKKQLSTKNFLVWDKDDKPAMDFVTACANVRAHIFSITKKSKFDIKSIAGNIIPAIATTNAMVAGLVVLHAFKVLAQQYEQCTSVYVRQKSSVSKTLLMAETALEKANPKCYVCAPQPFVHVFVDTENMTVKDFESDILKNSLNMIAPDVVLDGKQVVIISSEEGETEINNDKKLTELGVVDGSILKVDDFLQNYELTVCVNQYKAEKSDDPPYKITADKDSLKAKEETKEKPEGEKAAVAAAPQKMEEDDDDFCEIVYDDVDEGNGLKQAGASSSSESAPKKRKLNNPEEDDDIAIIDSDSD